MKHLLYLLTLAFAYPSFAQTASPITLVADICPGETSQGQPCSSFPAFVIDHKDKMLFYARMNTEVKSFSYNGVDAPDTLASPSPCFMYGKPTVDKNNLYYVDCYTNGKPGGIFKWDGVNAPEQLPGIPENNFYNSVTYLDGKLYIASDSLGQSSRFAKLREYNLATGELRIVYDQYVSLPTVFEDKIMFLANKGKDTTALYEYNTISGIVKYVAMTSGYTNIVPNHTIMDTAEGSFFFVGQTKNSPRNLFKYDGQNTPEQITFFTKGGSGISTLKYNAGYFYFLATYSGGLNTIYSLDLKNYAIEKLIDTISSTKGLATSSVYEVYHNKLIIASSTEYLLSYDLKKKHLATIPNPDTAGLFWASDLHLYKDAVYISAQTNTVGGELYKYFDKDSVVVPFVTTLYPNPTTGNAWLQFTNDTNQVFALNVVDMAGRTVATSKRSYAKGNTKIEIPAAPLAPGVYFCTVMGYRGTFWKGKLVKL